MTTPTLRQAAGSLLVVGLSGQELTGLERAWLRLVRPSGIILFRRNIANPTQCRALLAEATGGNEDSAMRLIDLEGGTVDRLREAFTPLPSAQAVARTADLDLMFQHGVLAAEEALAFGFNTNLAPVLDLALADSAGVMGTRSSSETPEGVLQYARAFVAGLTSKGVVGCGKHFPGLGGGKRDPHHETPSILRSWRDLWNKDMLPYRELANALPVIMVNHAAYPETKGGNRPATASAFWITSVLKTRMGYTGLIFSDDMEMGGILKFLPIEEAAIVTLRAGIHMMEICHSPELILRCFESIVSEAERSAAFRRLLLARAQEARRLRQARFPARMTEPLSEAELNDLKDRVREFSSRVAEKQPA